MKPIDLLLKQPEDVVDVDALFVRLLEIFSEIQVHRRQKLQRAFMDADEDGDGEMDYDEFKALCSSVGRGIKARYFAFGAAGTGVMELDDMDFSTSVLARRI